MQKTKGKRKKIKGMNRSAKRRPPAAARSGPAPSPLFRQALQHHQAGRLHEAEQLYRQELTATPNQPDALHFLGVLAHQTGNNQAATELINQAISVKPDYAEAHANLGKVLRAMGHAPQAETSLRQALALKPENLAARNNLGNLLLDRREYEEAVDCYKKVLKHKPDLAEALNNLGHALWKLGRLSEAEKQCRKAVSLAPKDAECRNNLANILLDREKTEEALTRAKEAIALNPESSEAVNTKGTILQSLDRFQEAITAHERAIALAPAYVEAHDSLGAALQKMNRFDQALASHKKALELKPADPQILKNIGTALQSQGRLSEAAEYYRKSLASSPANTESYRHLSKLEKFQEHNDEMRAMEELYLHGDLDNEQRMHLAFALGKAFEDLGEFDKAFSFLATGNTLKRASYSYDIATDQEFFRKIGLLFDPAFFKRVHGAGLPDRRPIFILGMPRSGTSLVEQILASHSQVFGAGELQDMKEVCYATRQSGSSPFPDKAVELSGPELQQHGAEYLRRLHEITPTAQFITDKMPHNFLLVGMIAAMLPQANIIHCQRSPMDTCLSIYKNYFAGEHPYAYDLEELGRYYRLYRELMTHWRRVLPGAMFELEYEELTRQPETWIPRILEYCGLPFEAECLEFHRTERPVRTASAAQVREPIYRDSVQLWKRYEKELEPLRMIIEG